MNIHILSQQCHRHAFVRFCAHTLHPYTEQAHSTQVEDCTHSAQQSVGGW